MSNKPEIRLCRYEQAKEQTVKATVVKFGEYAFPEEFPKSALDYYGLKVGDYFKWYGRNNGKITHKEIVPLGELTEEDRIVNFFE